MTRQAARDLQAERAHAEFLGWYEAQTWPGEAEHGWGDMSDAFKAGMQAQRDLTAETGNGIMTETTPGQAPAVPREPLEALVRAWSAKADETDRDPYAAAAYRIAKGNLVDVIGAAQEPQPVPGAPALREAVIAEVREAASCGSEEGDECPKCTRHAAAILAAFAAQEPKQALGGYVTINVRDLAIALNGCAGFTGNPAAFAGELHERLCRTVFAPKLAAAPDVRPREGEPGWSDVTCGICGAQFATNFRLEEIECGECEARRCPHCGTWFGEELP